MNAKPATKNPQPITRCSWCGTDPLYIKYHDEEWGKEVHDDGILFEFLVLESAQAGLAGSRFFVKEKITVKLLPILMPKK